MNDLKDIETYLMKYADTLSILEINNILEAIEKICDLNYSYGYKDAQDDYNVYG